MWVTLMVSTRSDSSCGKQDVPCPGVGCVVESATLVAAALPDGSGVRLGAKAGALAIAAYGRARMLG